jgi:hypothetical protein
MVPTTFLAQLFRSVTTPPPYTGNRPSHFKAISSSQFPIMSVNARIEFTYFHALLTASPALLITTAQTGNVPHRRI